MNRHIQRRLNQNISRLRRQNDDRNNSSNRRRTRNRTRSHTIRRVLIRVLTIPYAGTLNRQSTGTHTKARRGTWGRGVREMNNTRHTRYVNTRATPRGSNIRGTMRLLRRNTRRRQRNGFRSLKRQPTRHRINNTKALFSFFRGFCVLPPNLVYRWKCRNVHSQY